MNERGGGKTKDILSKSGHRPNGTISGWKSGGGCQSAM